MRAHGVAGDAAAAERFADAARELTAQVRDVEDRELLEADLATLPVQSSDGEKTP